MLMMSDSRDSRLWTMTSVLLLFLLLHVAADPKQSMQSSDARRYMTDVRGILVGHSSKSERATGCTVILCNGTCVGGVDVRGSAPGTRETDLLDPVNRVDLVHAIVFAGGSVFGLDAATGVVKCLAEKNIGFETNYRRVPIVPAAVLYDLYVGANASIVPDVDSGYTACINANNQEKLEGNVGVGIGATIGKSFGIERAMKGGLGSTSLTVTDKSTNATVTVAVLVAVNARGDVYKNGKLLAGARTADGKQLMNTIKTLMNDRADVLEDSSVGEATTLACIATDATLTKAQAKKVAQMAHDGFARAINPVHTIYDGDVVFTLATGSSIVSDANLVGMMAAQIVEEAIVRAVEQARSLPGLPSLRDFQSTESEEHLHVEH